MSLKISKYKLRKDLTKVTFRTETRNLVTITNDNITDELVALAHKNALEHCFVITSGEKKSISQSTRPLPESLSTLNEVPTVEKDLLTAQQNKREAALVTPPKKKGRPAKSKE